MSYLDSNFEECSSDILGLLGSERGIDKSSRRSYEMMQKILDVMRKIVNHEAENLIVTPGMSQNDLTKYGRLPIQYQYL